MAISAIIKEDNSRYFHSPQKKIENPHDKLFKETFGHVEVTKSFLENYLPPDLNQKLDMDTLRPEKDSFINEELEEGFSDLLFSVKMDGTKVYIYFLFEHKSYPDKATVFQLLRYMTEIWSTKMNKENKNLVPMVLPLIIYHGRARWNTDCSLGGKISGYNEFPETLRKFIPDFQYLLYDITNYSDEEIKGEARVRILFMMLRDIRRAENGEKVMVVIDKAITYLEKLDNKLTGIAYFETFMRYIVSSAKNLTNEDTDKIVKQVENNYPEGSEFIMTLADIWREEGIKKGEARFAKKIVQNAIKEGMDISKIEKLTGMSKKEIEEIKKEMEH